MLNCLYRFLAFLDKNVKLLTIEDKEYPPLLKEIPDYPISLYYKGIYIWWNNLFL